MSDTPAAVVATPATATPPPSAEENEEFSSAFNEETADDKSTPPAETGDKDEGEAVEGEEKGESAPPADQPPAKPDEQKAAEDLAAETAKQKEVDDYWQAVRRFHPDVDALYDDPNLVAWAKTQPPEVRAKLGPDATALDAIEALNLFKAQRPAPGEQAPPTESAADITDRHLRFLADNHLADTKIRVNTEDGLTELTMKELAKTYPDVFEANVVIFQTMMDAQEKKFQRMMQDAGYVRADDIRDLRAAADERAVLAKHSDAMAIEADPRFVAWKDKLDAPLKALYDGGTRDGRISILSLYKKEAALQAGGEHRAAQGKVFKAKASVHAETLRGAGQPPSAGKSEKSETEEFSEAFQEDEK